MNIKEFRAKYPDSDYGKIPDEELSDLVWKKFYKEQGVGRSEFAARFLPDSDPVAPIMDALKHVESKGDYKAKNKIGAYGAYQFMPEVWNEWSMKMGGSATPLPPTRENQDAVARWKVNELLEKGYTPSQIASIWHSGSPEWKGKKGVGRGGIRYNVPKYVERFEKEYERRLPSPSEGEAVAGEAGVEAPPVEAPSPTTRRRPSPREATGIALEALMRQARGPMEVTEGALGRLYGLVPETWGGKEGREYTGPSLIERLRGPIPSGPRGAALPEVQQRMRTAELMKRHGVTPEMVGEGEAAIGPASLAQLPVGMAALPAQVAMGVGEQALEALGMRPPEGERPATVTEIGKEWASPYAEAIRTRSVDPLIQYAVRNPPGALIDSSIFFGVLRGAITRPKAMMMRRKVKKEWNKAREDAEAAGMELEPGAIGDILMDAGVPPESVGRAMELMDQIPAYARRGPKPPPSAGGAPPPGAPPPAGAAARPRVEVVPDLAGLIAEEAFIPKRPEAHILRKAPKPKGVTPKGVTPGGLMPEAPRPGVPGPGAVTPPEPLPTPSVPRVPGLEVTERPLTPAEALKVKGPVPRTIERRGPSRIPERWESAEDAVDFGKQVARNEVPQVPRESALAALKVKLARQKVRARLAIRNPTKYGDPIDLSTQIEYTNTAIKTAEGIMKEEGKGPLEPKGPAKGPSKRTSKPTKPTKPEGPTKRGKPTTGITRAKELLKEEKGSIPGFHSLLHRRTLTDFPESSTKDLTLRWFEGKMRKGEISPDEVEWSGVKEWVSSKKEEKISKKELMTYLDENAIDLNEVWRVRGPKEGEKKAKWSKYVLRGGSNYRELLVTMPQGPKIKVPIRTAHFKERNILAHARLTDRTPVGEKGKMLFVEELQSDYHNMGRKYGYGEGVKWERHVVEDEYGVSAIIKDPETGEHVASKRYYPDQHKGKSVEYMKGLANKWADAQLLSRTPPISIMKNTWPMMMMKRIVREAVDKGYKWVGWSSGKAQTERWGGAERGASKLYDEILVNEMGKYARKFGSEVESKSIPTHYPGTYYVWHDFKGPLTPWVEFDWVVVKDPSRARGADQIAPEPPEIVARFGDDQRAAENAMLRMNRKLGRIPASIHAVRITPEMAEYVKSIPTGKSMGERVKEKLKEEKGAITVGKGKYVPPKPDYESRKQRMPAEHRKRMRTEEGEVIVLHSGSYIKQYQEGKDWKGLKYTEEPLDPGHSSLSMKDVEAVALPKDTIIVEAPFVKADVPSSWPEAIRRFAREEFKKGTGMVTMEEVRIIREDVLKKGRRLNVDEVMRKAKELGRKAVGKLGEEKGAITLHRRSDTERRFRKAMASYRKAVKAGEERATATKAAEAVAGTKPSTAAAFDQMLEATPPRARSLRNKAYEEEFWVPEPNSPNSESAIAYVKSGDFNDYLKSMPTLGEMKPSDVRGLEGVADVRASGHFVHTSFADQFVKLGEKGKATVTASDIPRNWAETLDPSRLIEWSDEKFGGELARKLLRPARDTIRARVAYEYAWDEELLGILNRHSIHSMRDRKLLGRLMLGEEGQYPQRVRDAVPSVRRLLDRGIGDMNAARVLRQQPPIPERPDYFPWVIEQTFRQKLFGERAKPEGIIDKAPPPDFIQPNQPFNPRELRRRAEYDAYVKEKDAVKVLLDYGRTAARDIFNTNIIHNNKVHARFLKDVGLTNLSSAIMDWTTDVFAGREHWIDRNLHRLGPVVEAALRGQRKVRAAKMRTLFALNLPWNAFIQTTSTASLLPRVGLINSVRGLQFLVDPRLRRFIASTYTHVMKSEASPEIAAFKPTAAKFRELDRRGVSERVADRLNFFTKYLEKSLTDHAIAAGYFEGKRMGLKGRDLLEFASDVGARVHSMYNYEDLPALLRSKDLKASFPLQTFAFEMMNNAREIAGAKGVMKGTTRANRASRLLKWYAGMYVTNQLAEYYLGRDAWSPLSFIPFGASLASLAGFEVSGGRYDAFRPMGVQFIMDTRKAARNAAYYDDWTATRQLINGWFVPAGLQLERIMATQEAVEQGGLVRSATGKRLFRIPREERARAYVTGPWATSEARKLKRGKEMTRFESIIGGVIPEEGVKSKTLRRMRREKKREIREAGNE